MAISTARLMVIEDWLDSVGDSAHHEARDAIRELIAVKEAEPVAEVSYHRFKQLTWLASSDDIASGTQLIRKPE